MKKLAGKGIFLAFALSVFCASSGARADSKGVLEGKTFSGTVTEKGDAKGDPDTFEFKSGQFHSTACDQYGYGTAPYTAQNIGGATKFESTTKNSAGATMHWQGVVKGDSVTGSAVMTTKSGETTNMVFEGKTEGAVASNSDSPSAKSSAH